MSGSAFSLPPEVVDTILDHLHDDHRTLRQCSLVSSQWLPTSRFHAFSSVTLTTANLPDFLELLNSPLLTLGPYVEDIRVFSLDSARYNASWLSTALPRLGSTLENSRSLALEGLDWFTINAETQSSFLKSFDGRLTCIKLIQMKFLNFSEVVACIASFPFLESLVLKEVGWDLDDEYYTPDKCPPKHLRNLELLFCYKRDIMNWFLQDPCVARVKRVDFYHIYDMDTAAAGKYLHALGDSLEELRVGFCGLDAGGDAEEFHKCVDFSQNTRLRSLKIATFIEYDVCHFQLTSPHDWILLIISQSRSLEEVTFEVAVDDVEQLADRDVHWDRYDQLLADPEGKSKLRRVKFCVMGDVVPRAKSRQDVRTRISAYLPKCGERGVLHFEFRTHSLSLIE